MNPNRTKIYLAGGLTSAAREDNDRYEIIKALCQTHGWEVYLPHEDTGSRNDVLDPKEVFEKNCRAIQESAIMIADVNVPSFGVGMECEVAIRSGISVIALVHQDKSHRVSRMLSGHPSIKDFLVYNSDLDLRDKLLKSLNKIKSFPKEKIERGHFFAFEGMDGAGKGTLISSIETRFKAACPHCEVRVISDPPKNDPWAKRNEDWRTANSSPYALSLNYVCNRMDQFAALARPILGNGGVVLADRFHTSWLIYQRLRLEDMTQINSSQIEYVLNMQTNLLYMMDAFSRPDYTFVLIGDPKILAARIRQRGTADNEYENIEFQRRVLSSYEDWHQKNSMRSFILDTSRLSSAEVLERVWEFITGKLVLLSTGNN